MRPARSFAIAGAGGSAAEKCRIIRLPEPVRQAYHRFKRPQAGGKTRPRRGIAVSWRRRDPGGRLMRTPSVGWTFMARLAVALLCCAIAPAAALAQATPVINLSGLPSNTVPGRNLTITANLSGSSGTPTDTVDF